METHFLDDKSMQFFEDDLSDETIDAEITDGSNEDLDEDADICLICKKYNQKKYIDILSVNTSTTKKSVADVLASIFIKRSMDDLVFYNTLMCQRCFNLLDRADELTTSLIKMKKELDIIKSEFRSCLSIEMNLESQNQNLKRARCNDSDDLKTKKRAKHADQITSKKESSVNLENDDFKHSICVNSTKRESNPIDLEEECNIDDPHAVFNDEDDSCEKIKCRFCGKLFINRDVYDKHVIAQHSSNEAKCPECNQQFYCRQYMLNHYSKAHQANEEVSESWKCLFCSLYFQQRDVYDQHVVDNHSLSMIKCPNCNEEFKSRKKMLIHQKKSHKKSGAELECRICGLQFEDRDSYVQHVISSECLNYSNYCDLCDATFKDKQQFNQHFKKCHSEKSLLDDAITPKNECLTCKKKFTDEKTFKRHVLAGHSSFRHPCDKCSLKFTSVRKLNNHKKIKHIPEQDSQTQMMQTNCHISYDILLSEPDSEFFHKFKMTKETFHFIYNIVKDKFKQKKNGNSSPDVKVILMLTLWHLLNRNNFRTLADIFGVSVAFCNKSVHKMIDILYNTASSYIKWPTVEEATYDEDKFRAISDFPGVVGVVDECLIKYKISHEEYMDSSNNTSVSLMAACNSEMKFLYISSAGGSDDNRMMMRSEFFENLSRNKDGYMPRGHYHIIASPSFNLTRNILVPFEKDIYLKKNQEKFNESIVNTKKVIKSAFGLLKERFSRLQTLDCSIDSVPKIVTVCCVLHNICLDFPENSLSFTSDVTSFKNLICEERENDQSGSMYRNTIVEQYFNEDQDQ